MPRKESTLSLEDLMDPESSAARAGLRYVNPDEPGLKRRPHGRGFTYLDSEGNRVTDDETRARIESLVIPPAWTGVWICADPSGHLQATGRDDRGRKQYIYHPEWDRIRNETKFSRMIPFGEALPAIRERCEADLRRRKLDRDKVLATVVTLLDQTLIRVGNLAYARENQSFGLTTLRDRHVDFNGQTCTFTFQGKSGKKHTIELNDARLARVVRKCRDIPGYELFQYFDEDGNRGAVDSTLVNEYIREIAGADFTAKDFRTWGGSVHAALALVELGPATSPTNARRKLAGMCRTVAERLGNTPSVCRSYYIHPALVRAFEDGSLQDEWRRRMEAATNARGLAREEAALLSLLRDLAE